MAPPVNRRKFLGQSSAVALTTLTTPIVTADETPVSESKTEDEPDRAVILLWLNGGPSTIDMWDLKPGVPTGGPFGRIPTTGEGEICEHLPRLAKQMSRLTIVRSMNTREADHGRGRYYLHTGFMPAPGIEHPSYGAVVARELGVARTASPLPPFVAIGKGTVGPGLLGARWAPLLIDADNPLANLTSTASEERNKKRLDLLKTLEKSYVGETRDFLAKEHRVLVENTAKLMRGGAKKTFDIEQEPSKTRQRFSDTTFGKGCLIARRLVEKGVPFVEVGFDGWDTHADNFNTLKKKLLPNLDQAMSALVDDLVERDLYDRTVVLCMGEFGRTPKINSRDGRDHWAKAWSLVIGGGGIPGGMVFGQTDEEGREVVGDAVSSENVMATVFQTVGIPLTKHYVDRHGRGLPLANGAEPIKALIAE
jgi:uncharacterized protein (DUF1501 family)